MELNKSQQKGVDAQKRIFRMVHPDATFIIREHVISKLYGTTTLRLHVQYTIINMLGTNMQKYKSWAIGARGKISNGT